VIRYLTLAEVLALHTRLLASSGGAAGIRDLGRVQAALAQPIRTFDGSDLYQTLIDKAAALGFSADSGSPVCRRERTLGHAMEVSLKWTGCSPATASGEAATTLRLGGFFLLSLRNYRLQPVTWSSRLLIEPHYKKCRRRLPPRSDEYEPQMQHRMKFAGLACSGNEEHGQE